MSLQKLSVKELKVRAKRKQSKLCPSYSKMKKSELVNYLQDSTSPTKSTWSPVKYEPSNLSNIEFVSRKNPTIESPFFVQRKKSKRSVRKSPRKTKKVTPQSNVSSMKVVELRQKLKSFLPMISFIVGLFST